MSSHPPNNNRPIEIFLVYLDGYFGYDANVSNCVIESNIADGYALSAVTFSNIDYNSNIGSWTASSNITWDNSIISNNIIANTSSNLPRLSVSKRIDKSRSRTERFVCTGGSNIIIDWPFVKLNESEKRSHAIGGMGVLQAKKAYFCIKIL